MKAVLASPSFLFRTELGPSHVDRGCPGQFPRHHAHALRDRQPALVHAAGQHPRCAPHGGGRGWQPGDPAGHRRPDRSPAGAACRAGLLDRRRVDTGSASTQLFAKTKDASLAVGRCRRPGRPRTSPQSKLTCGPRRRAVRELDPLERIREDRRAADLAERLRQRATGPALSRRGARDRVRPATPRSLAATWPASEGRSGLLTQPSYLWAQSDPALNSIVKRGKEIHDDVVCQDPVAPPVDLSTTPAAVNVLPCKSPDGTQDALDLRQRDPARPTRASRTSRARSVTLRSIPTRGCFRTSAPSATTGPWTRPDGRSTRSPPSSRPSLRSRFTGSAERHLRRPARRWRRGR